MHPAHYSTPISSGYEISEIARKTQITAEIFVKSGLDDAINLDRESFNFAHPHYQFIMRWLHSAFRQLSNRQKDLSKQIRTLRRSGETSAKKEKLTVQVEKALEARGIEDVPDVILLATQNRSEAPKLRQQGKLVLIREEVVPRTDQGRTTDRSKADQEIAEKKAVAITQLLQGMGLLKSLSFSEQEKLVRDIMNIVRG